MQSKKTPPASGGKSWSGRFSEPVDELVKRYTASVEFDQRLARFDIQGSLAHARMLHTCGVLSAQDIGDIERGLADIAGEIDRNEFEWSIDQEDVHLNIEKRLTELAGDAGKRLHTARLPAAPAVLLPPALATVRDCANQNTQSIPVTAVL